jgi:hypothetical protein
MDLFISEIPNLDIIEAHNLSRFHFEDWSGVSYPLE